ncbi:MAG: hypothetical protein WA740_10250 [Candidatus Binataceae bacterium]
MQKLVLPHNVSNVLGRGAALACQAERADMILIAWRHFFELLRVFPVVAEVIGIFETITGREVQVSESNSPIMEDLAFVVIRIGNTVRAADNPKLIQVAVLPVHNGLNDAVEARQREIRGYQDASPYQWPHAFEVNAELK